MIVSPLLGAKRQELLLCMCNFRSSVLCCYLKTGFLVSCAVFCQLVAMEKSGWKLCSPCVSISGPASCLLLLLQMEGTHWGTGPLSAGAGAASLFPWGWETSFSAH